VGIVILAKAPVAGRVKTRLELPAARTLALHRAMAEDVRSACIAAGVRPLWAVAGGLDHPWVDELRARGDQVIAQAEGDLGARIEAGLIAAGPGPSLALGMDSPTLPPSALRAALETGADVVLGPAFDGGYWLIGWREVWLGLLDGVRWSAETTLAETAAAAREAGLSVELVEFWYDVDTPADLAFLRNHLRVLPADRAAATRAAIEDGIEDGTHFPAPG